MLSKFDAVYSQLRTIKNMMKGSTAGHTTEQISQGIPEDLKPVEVNPVELKPCPICRRTFNPMTLEKHVTICEKTSQKRKVFDSFLQRSTGIGVGAVVSRSSDLLPKTKKYDDGPVSFKSKKKETTVFPKSQKDSTNRNMNRLATTLTSPSTSASTSASTSNAPKKQPKTEARPRASYWESKPLEQCPYCGRTFNDKALEGHVEWCKTKTVYGTFNQFCTTNNSPAKERMIARIHYQPPKPKRK
ncbi:hypothetical protein ACLKA6_015445 [Drosophila palustris]